MQSPRKRKGKLINALRIKHELLIKTLDMKKKFLIPAIIALVSLCLFIALTVFSKIYSTGDIPIQATGALLGAIITAFITMILLMGQSQAEELKERNVRVFEEKTSRYNKFIEELWKIWEDRRVTLEEVNDLIKYVSQDIILYTKEPSAKKILQSLNEIADYASIEKLKDADKVKLQGHVFEIINVLALEINLGGEISKGIQNELTALEKKIVPYLNTKTYKKKYLEDVNRVLETNDFTVKDAYYGPWYNGEWIWIELKNFPAHIIAGPISKQNKMDSIIAFYVDYWEYKGFSKYRDAARGWRKEVLRDFEYKAMIDFANSESVESCISQYEDSKNEADTPGTELANRIIDFYKRKEIDGKKIEQIVSECMNG